MKIADNKKLNNKESRIVLLKYFIYYMVYVLMREYNTYLY